MRIEGAIFDLDGTLTDSMYIWNEAPKALVRKFGGEPPEDLGPGHPGDGAAGSLGVHGGYILPPLYARTGDGRGERPGDREYRDRVPMKTGADTLLERLGALGSPAASPPPARPFRPGTPWCGWASGGRFRFAVSCLQYGPKTAPGIYLEAARRLGGRPERTLVFEDALHAARTAKAAGFLVCGVYDPSAAEDQAELRALSDWYLPRLDDPEFLSRLQQTED